ncbi:MAG TPA: hypothetical protein VK891_09470 [Euzebyales bacterium]|nr:hypothetical protein [Euzebyales bacterium]
MTASRDELRWLGFQGSRLHLELSGGAAVRLRDALDRALRGRAGSAPVQLVSWQLPDGRPLDVSVRLTDAGTDPGGHDTDGGDDTDGGGDGPAYGDVSGDFVVHAAACHVIAAGTQRYVDMPQSPEDAAAHDYQRIDEALDRHLPLCNGAGPLLRDDIRRRAVDAADATRPHRLDEITDAAPS